MEKMGICVGIVPREIKKEVAQPCEVSWEVVDSLVSVRSHFSAQGDKGEEEYP
jgi:hypothetical protein